MKIDPTVLVLLGLIVAGATVLAAMKLMSPEVFASLMATLLAWLSKSPLYPPPSPPEKP